MAMLICFGMIFGAAIATAGLVSFPDMVSDGFGLIFHDAWSTTRSRFRGWGAMTLQKKLGTTALAPLVFTAYNITGVFAILASPALIVGGIWLISWIFGFVDPTANKLH